MAVLEGDIGGSAKVLGTVAVFTGVGALVGQTAFRGRVVEGALLGAIAGLLATSVYAGPSADSQLLETSPGFWQERARPGGHELLGYQGSQRLFGAYGAPLWYRGSQGLYSAMSPDARGYIEPSNQIGGRARMQVIAV